VHEAIGCVVNCGGALVGEAATTIATVQGSGFIVGSVSVQAKKLEVLIMCHVRSEVVA